MTRNNRGGRDILIISFPTSDQRICYDVTDPISNALLNHVSESFNLEESKLAKDAHAFE